MTDDECIEILRNSARGVPKGQLSGLFNRNTNFNRAIVSAIVCSFSGVERFYHNRINPNSIGAISDVANDR